MSGFAHAHHMGLDPRKPEVAKIVKSPHGNFPDAKMKQPASNRPPREPIIDKTVALKSGASPFRAIRGVPAP